MNWKKLNEQTKANKKKELTCIDTQSLLAQHKQWMEETRINPPNYQIKGEYK